MTSSKRRDREQSGVPWLAGLVTVSALLLAALMVPDHQPDPAVWCGDESAEGRVTSRSSGWRRELGAAFRRVLHLKDLLESLGLVEEAAPTKLVGVFLDETGAPIPGVGVKLDGWVSDRDKADQSWQWTRPEPVLSDSLGRFELQATVRPGHGYAVIAQSRGRSRVATRVDDLRPGVDRDFGEIRLESDDWVGTARVFDGHGVPKVDFEFEVDVLASPFGPSVRARSSHDYVGKKFRTDGQGMVTLEAPHRSLRFPNRADHPECWLDSDGRDGDLHVELHAATDWEGELSARIQLPSFDFEVRVPGILEAPLVRSVMQRGASVSCFAEARSHLPGEASGHLGESGRFSLRTKMLLPGEEMRFVLVVGGSRFHLGESAVSADETYELPLPSVGFWSGERSRSQCLDPGCG